MRGVGRKPIRGRAAGISGTVRVHGSASGRLLDAGGGRLRFRRLATKGRVTLSALGTHFELPVAIVARSIVPDGVARVRCRRNRLTIHSASGVMRLTRR
jgi:hypothetical protein